MAKRDVFMHIGPALSAPVDTHAALSGRPELEASGLAVPAVDQDVMDLAALELLHRHEAAGLKRRDVEGAWAEVCRRVHKQTRKGLDVVISQPALVDADYQQVALALDGLVGLRLHLIVTPSDGLSAERTADWAGHWATFVEKQGRIHALAVPADPEGAELARAIVRAAAEAGSAPLVRYERVRRPVSAA